MQRAWLRFRDLPAVGMAFALVVAGGCGDDDEPSNTKSKDAGTEKDAEVPDMRIPTAGRSGSGGGGGTGGISVDSSAYTCKPRRGDIGGPSESGAECCGSMGVCTGAGDATSGLPHETCKAQPDLRCVPKPHMSDEDAGMSTGGLASCRVQLPGSPAAAPSYEGRCMANCFVQASPIASRLSQSTCDEGESCAPCYNPLTGETTGICELPGDSPLEPPPPAFKNCGEGDLGFCVPAYAAGNSAGQLAQFTCATGELCAPKNKVADPEACFEQCDTGNGLGPGACAPSFLAGTLSGLLLKSSCNTGELCIPCDAFNVRTGVCD